MHKERGDTYHVILELVEGERERDRETERERERERESIKRDTYLLILELVVPAFHASGSNHYLSIHLHE